MPRGRLDVKYHPLHVVEHAEVLVKDGFDLDEPAEDLGTSLSGKVRHLGLVAFLASCKVHLALAHLQGDTETPGISLQGGAELSLTLDSHLL